MILDEKAHLFQSSLVVCVGILLGDDLIVGRGACRILRGGDIIQCPPLLTMADFVRRLVSGDKARFKDEKLDLELGEPLINS